MNSRTPIVQDDQRMLGVWILLQLKDRIHPLGEQLRWMRMHSGPFPKLEAPQT